MSKTKAVLSLSGGMDSTTVLALALKNHEPLAVGFTYGSKHNAYEQLAARAVAGHYGVPYRLIDLSGIMAGFKSDLLKSGGPVPEGHYEEASMSRTVVPGRNTIFTAVLLGLAQSEGAEVIYLGVHAGDHHIYPDCRPEWFADMAGVVLSASENTVWLRAPFLFQKKADILDWGLKNSTPYSLTRTCYKDQEVACGRCGSCQERLEAFRLCGQEDPLPYESRELLPKA